MTSYRFAHCSDIHLPALEGVSWPQLANQRLLGYLSWRWRRQYEHRRELLDRLTQDLIAQRPDHILVTGDLTNLGLPQEYRAARRWLAGLGSPERVTVVPGNHDYYSRLNAAQTLALWRPYMASDGAGSIEFPSWRRRGGVVFIGLNTGIVSLPLMATGRVGEAQLARLADKLQQAKAQGLYRVLHLHHPPLAEVVQHHKRLLDAAALQRCLQAHGVELILYGHAHRPLQRPAAEIPAVGVASMSAYGRRHPSRRASYHLFTLTQTSTGWRMSAEVRQLDAEGHSAIATALTP